MSDVMSDEKWEEYYSSYVDILHKGYASTKDILDKKSEKEYLDKLVNDHWNYIKGLLEVSGAFEPDIAMCEYHYKTAAKHFWSHAREYYIGSTLHDQL